ncbi:MAG: nucleotidyltransferase family protein [Balneolaceae bacterium]|nr:nucleotidyltransferase family protein [Balneolaceae bacterium]
MDLNRNILRNRHRLSERQIDDFLEEKSANETPQDRMQRMQQIALLLKIIKLLREHGIEVINLKGPLLSERIYGDPTYRYSRDFDILVEPHEVNKTFNLLHKEGYSFPGFKWPGSKKRQEIALHFLNQIEMVHEKSGVMIEIHWKLFSTRITQQKTLDHLMQENIETVEFGGVELNRFSNEFELFYLIVHGGIHAWFRLKWLVDIREMLNRKTIDWESFHHIISDCNAQRLTGICNAMLREYFPDGTQLPNTSSAPNHLSKIASKQCRRQENDPKASISNTMRLLFYRVQLFPGFYHKLDVSKVLTFYKTDLKYNWLPPYKFVYYLFRPVGYLLRRVGVLK